MALLGPLAYRHLLTLCPHCWREYQAYLKDDGSDKADPDARTLSAAFAAQVAQLEKEHRQTERDIRELFALSKEDRSGRIRRARAVFRAAISLTCSWRKARRRWPQIRRKPTTPPNWRTS